jgi:ribosomal protein S12 methylthiotransferase accessory factor YcaO
MTNKHYAKWTAVDETKLIVMYNTNASMAEMAEAMDRTEHAVHSRLTKLRKENRIDIGDAHLQQELPFVVHEPTPTERFIKDLDQLASEVDKAYASDYIPLALYFGFGFVVGALTIITFGG